MKFEDKGRGVHAAVITCNRTSVSGRPFRSTESVRAIQERNGKWRIDRSERVAGTWTPWEPAGTSAEFSSLTSAKTALRAYARSCKR